MKRKSNKHINSLDFGIFHGHCLFICGFTYKEAHAWMKKKKGNDNDNWLMALEDIENNWHREIWGFVSRRTVAGKEYFFLVLRDTFDFSDENYTKLAHEILHLTSFHITAFLDPMKENEAFCYLHTYLMKNALKILRS